MTHLKFHAHVHGVKYFFYRSDYPLDLTAEDIASKINVSIQCIMANILYPSLLAAHQGLMTTQRVFLLKLL